jgi:thymidylate kinase
MICIIGVDGSGKTTHAKIIIDKFKQKKIPAKYVWFRYHHILSIIPLIYCRITGLTIYEKKDDTIYGRHEFYRSRIISFVYPCTLFIDMSITYCIKIVIPMKFGDILVSDRCIYDTLVDLMIDLDNFNFHDTFIGKLYQKLMPQKNTKIIFLDVHESSIVKRRPGLKYDTTLEKRRLAYQKLAQQFALSTVVNEGDINEVNEEICKSLKS